MMVSTDPVMRCFILDEFKRVESAATVQTPAEARAWFLEHGVPMDAVLFDDSGYAYALRKGGE